MIARAHRARIVMVACLVGLLGGCAPSTQLATNQARDYKGNPKRIYIVFHSVDEFGSTFDRTFIAKSSQLGKECGAVLEGTTITGLELDKNEYLAAMKASAPEALLVRAKADFHRGGTLIPIDQRAEALATDVNGKLKADGVLKCGPGGSSV